MKNLCTTCSWQPIQHIPVTRSMRFPAWIYPGRQSVDRRVARWSWERFLLGQIRVLRKTIRIWWRIHLGASDSNGVLSSRYLYDMWVAKLLFYSHNLFILFSPISSSTFPWAPGTLTSLVTSKFPSAVSLRVAKKTEGAVMLLCVSPTTMYSFGPKEVGFS